MGTEADVQCGTVHSLRSRPPPLEAAVNGVVISVWSVVLGNHVLQLFDKRTELPGGAILLPLWLQWTEKERGEKDNVNALNLKKNKSISVITRL